ncbi:MAG: hypothetical protein Q8J69_08975 [Sphingobacteriaceae bacterium]|nr:hypothetical protein [Sphingobacteriaceae bacterium]
MENSINQPASTNSQLPDDVLKCLADHGKLQLGPFLKALMEDYEEGDLGTQPSPKWIGVGIYEDYYHHGELTEYTQKRILDEAKSFLNGVTPYKKIAIAAYLYQQQDYRDFLEEDLEIDWNADESELSATYEEYEWKEVELQKRLQKAITTCDLEDMAHWLTKEAKVVEDIMGDTDSWDAESAANTNEYFERYLGFSVNYFKVFKTNHSDFSYFDYLMNDECELRANLEQAFESMPDYKDELESLRWYIEEHIGIRKIKRY